MTKEHIILVEMLNDLEKELCELNLWASEPPSLEALSSSEPFAIDTLNFVEWLQFIFIPRLYFMVENKLALPVVSGVAPMAEEYFSSLHKNSAAVIFCLQNIDSLLSKT